ncbi:MAG: bifunctional 4-hydroxy-2-oxoglutarate aldolase/2-dehydro-3-deoxy-phosphogluconate aldolase [Kiritimatiellae bacterium]|nr:bifunctional 4-hydroxy-2-oxoglutarate aldolase/2-dehydro-3-deoxy-phosphogluconate aldolase [Kiritimatiellia bacterium]
METKTTSDLFPAQLAERVSKCANIAVVVIDDPGKAVAVARTLFEGGVSAIELTLRTPCALDAMRRIVAEVPEVLVGAGTVLTAAQVAQAKEAGAAFAVAPGFNRSVVSAAADAGLPFAPGVMTPSEIEGAYEMGCTRVMKFFPASVAGGLQGLRTLSAPYKHLGIRFIPLGGLKADNTAEWLSDPLVAACGGSWIAPAKLIAAGDWAAIRRNAEIATAARDAVRKA